MDKAVLQRYLDICDLALHDPQYQKLYVQYQDTQSSFLLMMEHLAPEQQDIVLAYIATCSDLHLRLMELACQ